MGDIDAWIKDREAQKIFWIAGMVGTGKTSIAMTVCERASADVKVMLGGSFFCSRSTDVAGQRDIRCVVPTLAILLAQASAAFRLALAETIEQDVAIKNIAAQVEQLLRVPLVALADSKVPILFVIDGLDACGGETAKGMLGDAASRAAVADMVKALVRLTQSNLNVSIKFLVTARPEPHIRDALKLDYKLGRTLHLHAVDQEVINEDIRRYIVEALRSVPPGNLQPPDGITDTEIDELVQLSDGLFIIAATALSHTFDAGADAAVLRFKKLLGAPRDRFYARAAAPLERTYPIILSRVANAALELEPETTELQDLLRLLASALSTPVSVAMLGIRFAQNARYVRGHLSRLHAVVHVPDDDNHKGLRTVHASFDDYLFGRVSNDSARRSLGRNCPAQACLDLMGMNLRFNISQRLSSFELNPWSREPDVVTLSLQYVCVHWAHRVTTACEPSEYPAFNVSAYVAKVDQTSTRKLQSWPEVERVLINVGLAPGIRLLAAAAVSRLPQDQWWTLSVLSALRTHPTSSDSVKNLPMIFGVVAQSSSQSDPL